jgi:hypothetical protein
MTPTVPAMAQSAPPQAADAAGSADAERLLASLQGELLALRVDAEAQRAAAQQMRSRLAAADGQASTHGALMALVAMLGLVVAVLAWRLYGLRRGPASAGVLRFRGAAAEELAEFAGDLAEPALEDGLWSRTPGRPSTRGALQGDAGTPLALAADPQPERPDGVDELIDLEQEAEFFTLLGDDGAAIGLLERHIRRRGVSSPLPYLKQMDLHRQRGDRAAFDHAASRFAGHFAGDTPRWDAADGEGAGLEDFGSAVAELQALWPEPAQALDRIEAMLFPGPRSTLYDLAAYKDLLTLYQVARELRRMPESHEADVDLHLPLDSDGAMAVTPAPSIFDTLAAGAATTPMPPGTWAAGVEAAGIDVDLSEPASLDEAPSAASTERSAV